MAIERNIVEALTSFIVATGTQERAILIGGQAIRDWHGAQAHALTGAAISLPIPRATTDMDVHLLIEKEEREDVAKAIEADWTPTSERTGERVFTFTWRHDAAITLDLIATTAAQSGNRIQFFAKLGTGTTIGAVTVRVFSDSHQQRLHRRPWQAMVGMAIRWKCCLPLFMIDG